jgi:hypothetical protein
MAIYKQPGSPYYYYDFYFEGLRCPTFANWGPRPLFKLR